MEKVFFIKKVWNWFFNISNIFYGKEKGCQFSPNANNRIIAHKNGLLNSKLKTIIIRLTEAIWVDQKKRILLLHVNIENDILNRMQHRRTMHYAIFCLVQTTSLRIFTRRSYISWWKIKICFPWLLRNIFICLARGKQYLFIPSDKEHKDWEIIFNKS